MKLATVNQNLLTGSKELAELQSTKAIDTRGLVCPFPAFEAGKLAQSATSSDVLEIISNDEYVATTSIPSVLKIRIMEYSVLKNDYGTFLIKARRV